MSSKTSRKIVSQREKLGRRSHSDATRGSPFERSKPGVITGRDVQVDSDVEIINKDHVLATLTDDVPFMMEMVVESGRGYVPASEHSTETTKSASFPIDAVFCPITRVRYLVEETTRVDKRQTSTSLRWKSGPMVRSIPKWP